jgi:hypothetical protein
MQPDPVRPRLRYRQSRRPEQEYIRRALGREHLDTKSRTRSSADVRNCELVTSISFPEECGVRPQRVTAESVVGCKSRSACQHARMLQGPGPLVQRPIRRSQVFVTRHRGHPAPEVTCGCRQSHPSRSCRQFVLVDQSTEPVRSSKMCRSRRWDRRTRLEDRQRRRLLEGAARAMAVE